tara:strand:+ start:366 stop:722 length:357 start_codon:yes stop_codon:yes gene_type:complete
MDFLHFFKIVILSFIFIFLVHTIFNYFKEQLTDKKIYDYIEKPSEKYKDIEDKINFHEKENDIKNNNNENDEGTTNISDLDNNDMKSKLKNFLKDVQNKGNESKPYSGFNNNLSNNEL